MINTGEYYGLFHDKVPVIEQLHATYRLGSFAYFVRRTRVIRLGTYPPYGHSQQQYIPDTTNICIEG